MSRQTVLKNGMENRGVLLTNAKAACCALFMACQADLAGINADSHLSPTALVATKDGRTLYVACATANKVLRFDVVKREVAGCIPMPHPPSGLVPSVDEARLLVTWAALGSQVCLVDLAKAEVVKTMTSGHTTTAPVLNPDGQTLYVCNRFNHDVRVIDLASGKEIRRIPVRREPVAAALTRDGKHLLVANLLPVSAADADTVGAVVSVIDVAQAKVTQELALPNGSGEVRDIRVSPEGRFAAVTHLVASFHRATSHLKTGWINANALTLIDLERMQVHLSFLLDEPNRGAANPWALAWSEDGATLVVTHAGTHEVSVMDVPALLAAMEAIQKGARQEDRRSRPGPHQAPKPTQVFQYVSRYEGLDEGLPFLVGARQRIKLPEGDLGPRSVVMAGQTAYVANYFSDTLTEIDLSGPEPRVESIPLGPRRDMDMVRRGELYFHDATLCLEGWQSCASCHPDGGADGFNWDLLNDGIGNPKNTKSLLLAHRTPPAMFSGIRADAETAVRSGIKHILFTDQPEPVAQAIDEYLKSLQPTPSPHLVDGKLSAAALRGQKVFGKAGCAECHPPNALFTDLESYDVGTRRGYEKPGERFDVPSLIELWRTAPYLHDGSAATVRDVLTTRNRNDQHGSTSQWSPEEIDDLCAYLLSL